MNLFFFSWFVLLLLFHSWMGLFTVLFSYAIIILSPTKIYSWTPYTGYENFSSAPFANKVRVSRGEKKRAKKEAVWMFACLLNHYIHPSLSCPIVPPELSVKSAVVKRLAPAGYLCETALNRLCGAGRSSGSCMPSIRINDINWWFSYSFMTRRRHKASRSLHIVSRRACRASCA